jgi:hypothetical protein
MFGFLGLMGVGHIYGGHSARGWLLMVVWWIVLGALVLPTLPSLTPFTLVTTILIYCGGPLASGYWISNELRRNAP